MNYSELAEHREALLGLYDSLKSLCEDFSESGYEIDLVLKDIQKNVAEEKFLLAIFGEVKAGKSTFINALLKKEILPSDVLQATSEIIEVHKADKKKVKVTFTNDREKVVEDNPQTPEDEVALFLKDIASVNEKYRGIPIVQVNKFMIEHYNKTKEKAVIEEKELEAFLSSNLENIHNLDEDEFRRKIREYIEKNISCDNIPRMVSLYYSHDVSHLKHFRIVDTPGVNATGGLEDRTKDFIHEADAVICLHKPPPLESKSLRDILKDKLPERVKDRLILVLSHRSRQDENENEKIQNEAERLYSEIGLSNIFFVDSLTELHLPKFYKVETMDEIRNIFTADQKLGQLIASRYVEADNDRSKFLDLLEKQANFGEIRERIKKDAQKSASIQMKKFASHMEESYKDFGDRISEYIIKPRKNRYKEPQLFASKIQEQKDEIEKIKSAYNKSITLIEERFTGYIKEVDVRVFDSEQDISSHVEKLCQAPSDFVDSLVSKDGISVPMPIIQVDKLCKEASDAVDIKINAQLKQARSWLRYTPLFTIELIRMKLIERRIMKSRPLKILEEIKPNLKNQLKEIRRQIEQEYKSKFDETIREQDLEIKKFQTKEKENDELAMEISHFEKEKESIDDKMKRCQRIRGNL